MRTTGGSTLAWAAGAALLVLVWSLVLRKFPGVGHLRAAAVVSITSYVCYFIGKQTNSEWLNFVGWMALPAFVLAALAFDATRQRRRPVSAGPEALAHRDGPTQR